MPRGTSAWTEATWMRDRSAGPVVREVREALAAAARIDVGIFGTPATEKKRMRPRAEDGSSSPSTKIKPQSSTPPTSVVSKRYAGKEKQATTSTSMEYIRFSSGYLASSYSSSLLSRASRVWQLYRYGLPLVHDNGWECVRDDTDPGQVMYFNRRWVYW